MTHSWQALFQGELGTEFAGMLTSDIDETVRLAEEGQEKTADTCAPTSGVGCPNKEDDDEPKLPQPGTGGTQCKTCLAQDGCAESETLSGDDFSSRLAGWSNPPSPHASL